MNDSIRLASTNLIGLVFLPFDEYLASRLDADIQYFDHERTGDCAFHRRLHRVGQGGHHFAVVASKLGGETIGSDLNARLLAEQANKIYNDGFVFRGQWIKGKFCGSHQLFFQAKLLPAT